MKQKLIQLGCFDQPKDGWENYDITPHILISRIPTLPFFLFKLNFIDEYRYKQHKSKVFNKVRYLNLNKRLPFGDNTVDAYFSAHVFEHLFLSGFRKLLKEIVRTLKSDGIIRTVLPDLHKIIMLYKEDSPNEFLDALFENNNSNNYKNYHKWMYTKESFVNELVDAGFNRDRVEILDYNVSNVSFFDGMDNRPFNSFYIEARK